MVKTFSFLSKYLVYFSLAPLIVVLVYSVFTDKSHYLLYPENLSASNISIYTDSADGGLSKFDSFLSTKNNAIIKYQLLDNTEFFIPYVGMSIRADSCKKQFDLTKFDLIKFKIEVSKRQTCYVILNLPLDTQFADTNSIKEVSLAYELALHPRSKNYTLPLKKMFIPDWWYFDNNIGNKQFEYSKLKKIRSINLHLGSQSNNNSNTFKLSEISFIKTKYKSNIARLSILYIVYFIILIFIHIFIKQHVKILSQREKIAVPFKTLDKIKVDIDLLKTIITFLGTNYTDENISIKNVALNCKTTVPVVSQLLKKNFLGITFRQYLNIVRVHEAKRLLLNSDMNIQEVCYAVGFSNVTHFNRTFKKILETTPSYFRKSSIGKKIDY